METIFTTYFASPIGDLKLIADHARLRSIQFDSHSTPDSQHMPLILQQTITQLTEYFAGTRKHFELALAPKGSEFQQKIWKLVERIPYGATASYRDIAQQSGSEKKARAVGLANGKNPIPIIIPCHRVIGSRGQLTGYAGGLERKRFLLLHEQKYSTPQHQLFQSHE